MALFLENYVRAPIDRLIKEAPQTLPKFVATMSNGGITLSVGDETLSIVRRESEIGADQHDEAPDDIGDSILD